MSATSPVRVESLESRALLSSSASLGDDGVLSIRGSGRDDKISVYLNRRDANRLEVKLNRGVSAFDLRRVRGLRVDAGNGRDRIDLSESNGAIRLPSTLYCGDGDDSVSGASGRDRVYGGAGDDSIRGGSHR